MDNLPQHTSIEKYFRNYLSKFNLAAFFLINLYFAAFFLTLRLIFSIIRLATNKGQQSSRGSVLYFLVV